jgi:hypothetical protein
MNVRDALNDFYEANGIPKEGGVDDTTFKFRAFGFSFRLPNPKFRREALHIHDIQHVLLKKDTSWEGESYISGWEIATGMWKHFLLGILGLWAMGYGMWLYPKAVYQGFKRGLQDKGVIDLGYTKEEFMEMDYIQLEYKVHLHPNLIINRGHKVQFLFWVLVSQFVLFFPLIVVGVVFWAI